MKVLFICTGNTCRSYMAEVIMEKLAADYQLHIQVNSAGIQAHNGIPAYPYARLALKRNGYFDKKHYSRSISSEMIEEYDIIITMEVKQRDYLKFSFPEFSEKIKTLAEVAIESEHDIDDPVALEYREYEKTFKKIEEYMEMLLNRLVKNKSSEH